MASRTQIRLQQLTGSLADLKTEATQYAKPSTAITLTGSDLQDVLGVFGAALNRMHGAASSEPFNNTAGLFRSEANAAGALTLKADAGTSQTILLVNDEGTASNAIDLVATAGGFSIDGVQESNITVTSAGAADDLLIQQVGGNDSSILITAAGTGADAVSIDATAGSMVIAPSLIDGKTLKLGNNASTEMVFTPSGTAGDEKISVINKAGTADDAILIDSEAGGVTIAAGNDSLVLDADGTDSDAINVDSAGGVDVDAVGDIALNSSAKVTLSGSSGVDSVHIESALKVTGATVFDANVTIDGNLDINGTTTTIDTTNLSVEDSIIALGVSGSDGSFTSTGDRGILFPRGTAGSAVAGFFWDGTNFNLGLSATGPTSGSFATVDAANFSTLKLGNLLPGDDDRYDLGSTSLAWQDLHLEGDVLMTDAGKVETTAGDLTISSAAAAVIIDAETDITLDAKGNDIFLKDNGALFGSFTNSSNTLILSGGAAGGDLAIEANSGTIKINQLANHAASIISDLANSKLTVTASNGNNLILGSNDTIFGFEIKEQDIFAIKEASNEAILSSSAGRQLMLASNNGKVGFKDPAGSPGQLFEIDTIANASATLMLVDAFQILKLDANPSGKATTVSGSFIVDGGAAAGSIAFLETTPNGTGRVVLRGPAAVNSNDTVTLTLPDNDGNASDALISDGSGNLSFAAIGATAARKGVFIMTASISAGSVLGTNHGQDLASDAITFGGVAATQGRLVDVFVNGQLLTSGSAAERGSATAFADYEIASTTTLKFAFDLEADDVVQVVKRG